MLMELQRDTIIYIAVHALLQLLLIRFESDRALWLLERTNAVTRVLSEE